MSAYVEFFQEGGWQRPGCLGQLRHMVLRISTLMSSLPKQMQRNAEVFSV